MGIPGSGRVAVAVAAPGAGPGFWAGASSAAFAPDGELVIAYRLRTPDRRGARIAIARSGDGERFITIATLDKERLGAESLERPALVHTGSRWRLYVSCATPGTKHWRIDVLESREAEGLAPAPARTVFPGSDSIGVKDPVVRRIDGTWHAWICCHPLDVPGEEDRMTTAHATSDDGLEWSWHGVVLAGRPGMWDARGARVTSVLPDGSAYYDGRATKEENFSERTGLAVRAGDALVAENDEPLAGVRYLDVVASPSGERLAYYERPRQDGSHELCVERLTR